MRTKRMSICSSSPGYTKKKCSPNATEKLNFIQSLASLETLHLSRICYTDDYNTDCMKNDTLFKSIKSTDNGLQFVETLRNLTDLDLSYNSISTKHIQGLTKLTSLNLSYCKIGNEGIIALSGLVNLTDLNIQGNELYDRRNPNQDICFTVLQKLNNLEKLDMRYNDFSVVNLNNLTKIRYLNLEGCGKLHGFPSLRNIGTLTSLTHLNINIPNCICDRDLGFLRTLTNLTHLTICKSIYISDGIIRHLAQINDSITIRLHTSKKKPNIGPLLQYCLLDKVIVHYT